MPSWRACISIPVSSCIYISISTWHLVAMMHSTRSRPARRHTSTITLCSSVQKVYVPTRLSMRGAMTARCAAESRSKSPFRRRRRVGPWSATSRCWLKSKTCGCSLGICCPYFDVSPARSRNLRCRHQRSKSTSRPRHSLRKRRHTRIWRKRCPSRSSSQMRGTVCNRHCFDLPFSLSLRITYA
jgi:hypothetical protein